MTIMQPNDVYLKSKRNLLIFCSILLLSIYVGVEEAGDGNFVSFFPVKLANLQGFNYIGFFAVMYFTSQFLSFWLAQNEEIRNLIHFRIDFYTTSSTSIFSIISAFYVFFRDDFLPYIIQFLKFPDTSSFFAAISFGIAFVSLLYVVAQSIRKSKIEARTIEGVVFKQLLRRECILVLNPNSSKGRKNSISG